MRYWKIIRNICVALAVAGMLAETCKASVSASTYNNNADLICSSFDWNEEGVYPVSPGDGIWEQLSYAEQLKALSMPEEKLQRCTSEELAEWVLEYPFLADILAFDTAEQAIDYFRRTSNICCEFFSREDASDILLKEYDELCVDYAMLDDGSVESPWTDSGYTKELFLQTYFADSFSKLSESEKDELKSIAGEKYIEKLGICEDYSTALLFYEFVQEEYGYIPENMVPEAIAASGSLQADTVASDETDHAAAALTNSGFVSSGRTVVDYYSGATYYVGTYTLYGVTADCLKYKSGNYSAAEISQKDAEIAELHPSWRKVYSASTKYNCHSYAWIDASQTNVYWLNNPDAFANSSSFSYIGKNGSAASGDRIIIGGTTAGTVHSLISISNGTNSLSINTTSKLGRYGVYDAPLIDMMIYYVDAVNTTGNMGSSYYEVYR